MKKRFIYFFAILHFLSCSQQGKNNLPEIHIRANSEIPKDKKIPCEIIYVENGDSLFLESEIKRRGGASMKYKKHSYRIELLGKIALADLPADDDWILNANYIDKTFMRHKINYDLFRKMHPENIAVQSAYTEVFLNGEYRGLYVLMEKIDASTTFLQKKNSGAMLFKEPPIFFEERLAKVQEPKNYFQQKVPKKKKIDKTEEIEAFHQFLFNSPDSVFYKKIESKVNLRNVIDWHLLLLFSNNSDGILKNFYLLKRDFESPFEFIPWDYDHSFGRDSDNELNMMRHELDVNRAVLLRRLNDWETYRSKLMVRYFQLRANNVFSIKNFENMLHENDKIIRPHVDRNFEKWPTKAYYYFDDAGYDAELKVMKDYVKMRVELLDNFFSKSDFPKESSIN